MACRIHTDEYDVVLISDAGAQLIKVDRPDDDLWVVGGVGLDQLKLVALFCDEYADNAANAADVWRDKVLHQSLEWRFELVKAADAMGVHQLVGVVTGVTTQEE